MYTINFDSEYQETVNFYPVNAKNAEQVFEKELPCGDYKEVVQYSIKEGFINSLKDAKTFCDGNGTIQPYFTSNSITEEVCTYTDNCEDWSNVESIEFDAETFEYNFF